MHLRIARETGDPERAAAMYRDGLGLAVLGSFEDHAGYDGVMLGAPGAAWHLEFTRVRGAATPPPPGEDDLLVFYEPDPAAWTAACSRVIAAGFREVAPRNPYWAERGRTFADADGHRIVLQQAAWAPLPAVLAGRLPHDAAALAALRRATPEDPLRVLVSGCITGMACGVDGTDYGMGGSLDRILALPAVEVIPFCPEDHGLGTPRTMPDIHGGDGRDVLATRARVLDETGADLTEGMVRGARAMLEEARRRRVELAMLTDMSAACGSQVISDGCRFAPERRYRRGVGVAAALLLEAGIPVVSQRDYRTLERLRARLDPGHVVDEAARDHHETAWYRDAFGGPV